MKTKMLTITGLAFFLMWCSLAKAKTFPTDTTDDVFEPEQNYHQCDYFLTDYDPDFSDTPCESGNFRLSSEKWLQPKGGILCCCRGDCCTRGFHIVPETPSTEEPEQTLHVVVEEGVISMSSFLEIYIPAVIIFVACVAVGYYFWRKRKRCNPEMDRDRGDRFKIEDNEKQDSFTCPDDDHDSGAFSTEDTQDTEPIFLSRVLTVD